MTHEEIFTFPTAQNFSPLRQEYLFGVIGTAHTHIIGMSQGLLAAGAKLAAVYDPDPAALAVFLRHFPDTKVVQSPEQILCDPAVRLIASAAVPSDRAGIAIAAMEAGKDCMVDKAPLISLEQLAALKATIAKTGRKYSVYYGESIDNEAALFARDLLSRGVIGKLCHVDGFAPHRLNAPSRPAWFFQFAKTGGILTDLVCHQLHQFLAFLDAQGLPTDVVPVASRVGNLFHSELGELQDFGDTMYTAACGVSGYFRVDWNSPEGLSTWGDSRMILSGEDGCIELRKNCDIARSKGGNHIYIVNRQGEFYENVSGKIQKTYFPRFIRESLEGYADPHALQLDLDAIELTIRAQMAAVDIAGT
ncbi:MAG: Gfo/Idh/MocA family oxidoreductase [Clostridia bacterium]|nr:Gfo/Idh/MocA family oxidoreductase [Clostridia bacterium]